MPSPLQMRNPTAETIPHVVYEALRTAIINGVFKPGERLVERQLSEELKVSRTPVREGLYRLQKERLVERVSYRGFFVASLTEHEAMAIYETRLILEPQAARLAAERSDPTHLARLAVSVEAGRAATARDDAAAVTAANAQFHLLIAEASGNPWLLDILTGLQGHISLLRHTSITKTNRSQSIVSEHDQILAALVSRDGAAAEAAVRHHLLSARENLAGFMHAAPDGAADSGQRGS